MSEQVNWDRALYALRCCRRELDNLSPEADEIEVLASIAKTEECIGRLSIFEKMDGATAVESLEKSCAALKARLDPSFPDAKTATKDDYRAFQAHQGDNQIDLIVAAAREAELQGVDHMISLEELRASPAYRKADSSILVAEIQVKRLSKQEERAPSLSTRKVVPKQTEPTTWPSDPHAPSAPKWTRLFERKLVELDNHSCDERELWYELVQNMGLTTDRTKYARKLFKSCVDLIVSSPHRITESDKDWFINLCEREGIDVNPPNPLVKLAESFFSFLSSLTESSADTDNYTTHCSQTAHESHMQNMRHMNAQQDYYRHQYKMIGR